MYVVTLQGRTVIKGNIAMRITKRPLFRRCGQRYNCSYVVTSDIVISLVPIVYSVKILLV